jgi:hypothetical protein
MRQVSKKRQKQLQRYYREKSRAAEKARADGTYKCWFDNKKLHGNTDWHHKYGRDNDMIFEGRVFVRHNNHMLYHNGTYEQLSAQPWYENWLAKLKKEEPRLYYKEINRKDK